MPYVSRNGVFRPEREPSDLAHFDVDPGSVVLNGSSAACDWNRGPVADANRNYLQPTALNQPAHTASDADLAGHGSLAFSGVQQMDTGALSAAMPSVATHYLVVVLGALVGTYGNIVDNSNGSGGRQCIGRSNGNLYAYAGTILTTSATYAVGSRLVICVEFNGASSAIYVNDPVTPAASGNTGASSPGYLTLGNHQTSYPCGCRVGMHSVFSGIPGAALRTLLMRRYGQKYGVLVS